jgi:hypothetical protein
MGVSYAFFMQSERVPVLRTLESELSGAEQKSLEYLRELAEKRKHCEDSGEFVDEFLRHQSIFGWNYYLDGNIPRSELNEIRSLYIENTGIHTQSIYEKNRERAKIIRKQQRKDRAKMEKDPNYKPLPGSLGYCEEVFLDKN